MVLIWLVFATLLFILAPFLHRLFVERANYKPDATFRTIATLPRGSARAQSAHDPAVLAGS